MAAQAAPATAEEAASLLRGWAGDGAAVRITGGGTKAGWGHAAEPPGAALSTAALNSIAEHNHGDLTAVVGAGLRVGELRAILAEGGQMLALDPPLGAGDAATIGGLLATGDSGPLRHRHGAPRDLVLGVTVVLSDGTVARAGGKVIKNVAGYDLAKLFTGSFGTLGLIAEVAVRLHPKPPTTATAVAESDDAGHLAQAASALAHSPLEMQSLDLSWGGGQGAVLARFAGAAAPDEAAGAATLLATAGLEPRVIADDDDVWSRQREAQRSPDGAVVRVSGLPADLAGVCSAADAAGGSLVSRAALGLSWVRLPPAADDDLAAAISSLRAALAPAACVVLDAPAAVRATVDPWDDRGGPTAALMRRVKERFDPTATCNPGVFAGGL